jgi:hypothetical protein
VSALALVDRPGTVSSTEHDLLVAVSTPAALGVGWLARNTWTTRRERKASQVREVAIDRTAQRVERADLLDRLEADNERKAARIEQLETDGRELRDGLAQLSVEVARYRAGLVAPSSYVLIPRSVVAAIRTTHPQALPGVYPGEEMPHAEG